MIWQIFNVMTCGVSIYRNINIQNKIRWFCQYFLLEISIQEKVFYRTIPPITTLFTPLLCAILKIVLMHIFGIIYIKNVNYTT